MKKIISVIIICLLLSSVLVIPASAAYYVLEENDQVLRFYNAAGSFRRIDDSMLQVEYTVDMTDTIKYTGDQIYVIKNVKLRSNADGNLIRAEIYYKDGTCLISNYLREDYIDEYAAFVNDSVDSYTLDFTWPEGNFVNVDKSAISGKLVYLYKDHILNASHILPMNYQTADGALVVPKGAAVILEDKCYFVKYDNYNSGLQSINDLYNCATNSTSSAALVSAYEIADEATLKAIKDAEEKYYGSDFGFLYDDDFTKSLSAGFLIILFGVLPLGLFVLFLILAIRSKTIYKKLFTIVYISSAVLVVVFAILALLITAG
ncbi:MAG: hypothetical protein E7525_01760 [Ruminococcaceae bacterium]|nr:hypothetical protein [Oscillospiraceae bacterium]